MKELGLTEDEAVTPDPEEEDEDAQQRSAA